MDSFRTLALRTITPILIVMGCLSGLSDTSVALADPIPYEGYGYDDFGRSIPAPIGYRPSRTLSGNELWGETPGTVADLFLDEDGCMHLLDSSRGRILRFDADLVPQETIHFHEAGKDIDLQGASGLFCGGSGDSMRLYVADPLHSRVIVADRNGGVIRSLGKPDSDLMPASGEYRPSRVIVDAGGTLQVLAPGVYAGAIQYAPDGTFLGFFGSNRIAITPAMLMDAFWKQILNPTQRSRMMRYVPIEYVNFDIDRKGFVYACSSASENSRDEIRILNAAGTNILAGIQADKGGRNFGDLESTWRNQRLEDTSFIDVEAMDGGLFAALDATRGRIFIYDGEGVLLTIFGGSGMYQGAFRSPVALESRGDRIYVADSAKGSITVFEPTEYGTNVLNACRLNASGQYEKARGLWEQVVRIHPSFGTAQVGIGKSLMGEGRYQEAMIRFRLGEDRRAYSQAFDLQRRIVFRRWFLAAVLLVLFLAIALRLYFDRKRRLASESVAAAPRSVWIRTLYHPIEGVPHLVRLERLGIWIAAIAALWFLSTILHHQALAFPFNPYQTERFDLLLHMSTTLLVLILFCTSNWLICTALDGKGRMSGILAVSTAALLPVTGANILAVLVSHATILAEAPILVILRGTGAAWGIIVLVLGLMTLHEYSFRKTIGTLLLTLFGVLLIVFLAVLVWALFQQIVTFIATLTDEIGFLIEGGGA